MASVTKSVDEFSRGSPEPAFEAGISFLTHPVCPYAQRSWIALAAKGVNYKPYNMNLREKAEWWLEKYNPVGQVPTILIKDDAGHIESVVESLVCNEFLEEAFPEPALLPRDPIKRAQARVLIDRVSSKFGSKTYQIFFKHGTDQYEEAKQALDEGARWVEQQLPEQGPYMLGSEFSLVDAGCIPFALRADLVGKLMTGYEFPPECKKLRRWVEACMKHPAVVASMQSAPGGVEGYAEYLHQAYIEYAARARAAAANGGSQ